MDRQPEKPKTPTKERFPKLGTVQEYLDYFDERIQKATASNSGDRSRWEGYKRDCKDCKTVEDLMNVIALHKEDAARTRKNNKRGHNRQLTATARSQKESDMMHLMMNASQSGAGVIRPKTVPATGGSQLKPNPQRPNRVQKTPTKRIEKSPRASVKQQGRVVKGAKIPTSSESSNNKPNTAVSGKNSQSPSAMSIKTRQEELKKSQREARDTGNFIRRERDIPEYAFGETFSLSEIDNMLADY